MWRVLLLSAAVACTKPNPEVCCLDATDCASIGVEDPARDCSAGLACVDHTCQVPTCSTEGCGPDAPVCEIRTDVCAGCTDSTECTRFPDTSVCEPSSGACVQCVEATDCGSATPVCDANACRACVRDSECDSGACGNDGACVDEAAIVYLAPNGTDAGDCSRSSPCKLVKFGLTVTSPTRNRLVMAQGTYLEGQIAIDIISTSASEIFIHGGGASITFPQGDGQAVFGAFVPTTIRDLDIVVNPIGIGVDAGAATVLERLNIRGTTGIRVQGPVTARDLFIDSSSTGGNGSEGILVQSGSLSLERATLTNGAHGIKVLAGTTVELTNVLVYGTDREGINFAQSNTINGSLNFVTIADTGGTSTVNAGLTCPSVTFPVRSTIIWTPESNRPSSSSCAFVSSIVGPQGVAGATNSDPRFVSPIANDYHLGPNSPAIDMVNVGPPTDFEGDARPSGERFDIGADER